MNRRKTLAALVSGPGWHVVDLARAARALDVAFHALPFPTVSASIGMGASGSFPDEAERSRSSQTVWAEGVNLSGMDGVLVRMMPPGGLEQVVFRMDALQRLAASGVPVLNPPRAVEAAVDKYLTLALLAGAGLPVPPTWAGQSAAEGLLAFEELGGDVAIKPLFGSEGRGLLRVCDRELAWRALHAIERLGSVLYLQKIVRCSGEDVRAFVLDGAVLGSMRRRAAPGEWRANVAQGGRAEPCRLDTGSERLALAAASALGARMAGVDLVFDLDRDRWTILEVNAVPGWRALARVTGIDVAAAVLAALRDRSR